MKIVEQDKKKVLVTQSIVVWAVEYALLKGFPMNDDCVSNLTDIWNDLESIIQSAIISRVEDALISGKIYWQNTECWESLLNTVAPEIERILEED